MLIYNIATISSLLILWNHTNVVVEYCLLFGKKFKRFEKQRLNYPNLKFATYLAECGWWGRLLACPLCLCFWLSLIFCLPGFLTELPLTFVSSLFVYYSLSFLYKKQ